jgi:ribose 5-phosphate isomerase A
MDTAHQYKVLAARRALDLVTPGMTLGLGTGSTANEFIRLLGERNAAQPLNLTCIATSNRTASLAQSVGLAINPFDSLDRIDLTVDGADEIAPTLDAVKGAGGALLHEKIVAMASDRVCLIADQSKRVDKLGAFPLPVEIVPFGAAATVVMIEAAAEDAGCKGPIRVRAQADGHPFVTDSGHWIADCAFGSIPDAELLADVLALIPGVVEHGLFLSVADEAYIAGPEGMTTLRR